MRILEALLVELKRLDTLSKEEFEQEMTTNEEFGILVFAAKDELESIAWCTVKVPVWERDVEDKNRVNAIVEKVLAQ